MKSIGGGGANKISLGLGGGFDGHRSPDLLEKFSDHVNAPHYELWPEWEMVSMSDDAGFMGDSISNKMRDASEIHFNLDGFDNNKYQQFLIERASRRNLNDRLPQRARITERLSFWDKDTNNITNWEYNQIVTNNNLFNKTTFYGKGGQVVPRDQLLRPN